jgi:acyl carrier protein
MTTGNRADIERAVLRALASVAPEADTSALNPKAALREELDLDSMDYLNFIIAVHDALSVDIPERDYPKLTTLESCIDYLIAKAPR